MAHAANDLVRKHNGRQIRVAQLHESEHFLSIFRHPISGAEPPALDTLVDMRSRHSLSLSSPRRSSFSSTPRRSSSSSTPPTSPVSPSLILLKPPEISKPIILIRRGLCAAFVPNERNLYQVNNYFLGNYFLFFIYFLLMGAVLG